MTVDTYSVHCHPQFRTLSDSTVPIPDRFNNSAVQCRNVIKIEIQRLPMKLLFEVVSGCHTAVVYGNYNVNLNGFPRQVKAWLN
ncbi:unnamed protein product [Heterotrigona itama]|uniref:Uncharacterized protein n=1 Tax=Heterotrigona itama TaxID=395501 RepID=A0A6V7H8G2_9HYME|nr:unnamed protein product [Heterotrigona itama]